MHLKSALPCRILDKLGADVRVYDPQGLPVKDDVSDKHPKAGPFTSMAKLAPSHALRERSQ